MLRWYWFAPVGLVAALVSFLGAAEEITSPAATTPSAPVPAVRPLAFADAVRLSATTVRVSIAKLDAAIARAGLGAERQALLPTLNATGAASRGTQYQPINHQAYRLSPDNTFDARLRLGQALLDLEAWNRTAAADHRLSAADASATFAMEESAGNAAEAYVSLALAQALVEVRRQDLTLAEELLRLTTAQVDAGATEAIAATRAESRVADGRSALISAEGAVSTSAISLARALNLDPAAPVAATDALTPQLAANNLPEVPETAVTLAARQRPELMLSAETLRALDAERRAARGARLPRVDGFADGGRIGPQIDDTTTTWQIGLQVTIPLIDRSRFDEASARYSAEQQRLRFTDLGMQIAAEVRTALSALTTSRGRLGSNVDALRLTEREVSEARTRFTAGVTGNLELIDAQRNLTSASVNELLARQQVVINQVRLARAVGAAAALH